MMWVCDHLFCWHSLCTFSHSKSLSLLLYFTSRLWSRQADDITLIFPISHLPCRASMCVFYVWMTHIYVTNNHSSDVTFHSVSLPFALIVNFPILCGCQRRRDCSFEWHTERRLSSHLKKNCAIIKGGWARERERETLLSTLTCLYETETFHFEYFRLTMLDCIGNEMWAVLRTDFSLCFVSFVFVSHYF